MNAVVATPVVLLGKPALVRGLVSAMGDERKAEKFLQDVLWDAGYDDVPEKREEFEAFVREEVLPRLLPHVRLEELHDLVRRTIGEEGSLQAPPLKRYGSIPDGAATTPVRRARVVVVESDDGRRISIARELVRGGMDVEVVATPAEVLGVDAFHAVVISLSPEGRTVIDTLAGQKTRAGLVTYDEPGHREALRDVIERWPNDRVAVVPPGAAAALVSSRVRIVVMV